MAAIELILLQRVDKLGQMGDVVRVKPGFARNYLLPQRKAIRANKDSLAKFEAQRAQLEALNIKRRDEAERVAERMGHISVVIIRQAGESGGLYGSVSSRDIADGVVAAGLTVDAPAGDPRSSHQDAGADRGACGAAPRGADADHRERRPQPRGSRKAGSWRGCDGG